jgi:hypothetical protein
MSFRLNETQLTRSPKWRIKYWPVDYAVPQSLNIWFLFMGNYCSIFCQGLMFLLEIFTSDELMIGDCILFDLVVNEAYYKVSVQSVASLGMQWKMFSKVVTVSFFFFCMGGAVPFDV